MQLAADLKAAGLGVFPCWVRHNAEKNKWEKHPLTVDKEPWAATAARPLDDPAVRWPGVTVVGVPVPQGVFVLDLDTYNTGTTREAVEAAFGCSLPWDAALIQRTIGGGEHYAFRLPSWPVRQGTGFGGLSVDTRTHGRGFICSGDGYTAVGFGVLRLAFPESLPEIPDGTRPFLEAPDLSNLTPAPPPPETVHDDETAQLAEALAFVDPDCHHDEWIRYGMALRHHFNADPDAGFALFDQWSAGVLGDRDCPASYIPEEVRYQYWALKPIRGDGRDVTISTIFYAAIAGGWVPPARFDTALAFGSGAVPVDVFNRLAERITESGSDSREIPAILEEIRASGCNALQAGLLRSELKAAMRSAKILDRDLSAMIDQQLPVDLVAGPSGGLYGKNHMENATQFLAMHHPEGTLLRSDENWYAFEGKCWRELCEADMDHVLTKTMAPSLPQRSTVSGTLATVASLVHRPDVDMHASPAGLVLFNNGVLDLATGELMAHDKKYLTTKIVPYDLDPMATAPRWLQFLDEVFEGDAERVALLQEWLGYMLSPTYQYQKIMFFLGAARAGKSIIGEVLHALVGDENYTGASLESLAADDFLDSLRHKTVAFSGDTQKGVSPHRVHAVIERLKKISGNDAMDFGRKYKSRMTTRLPTRITLSANQVPRLFDDSSALSGRLLVLTFDVSYLGREDPYLRDAVLQEIPGIALWALEGLARLNSCRRFTIPAASVEEMESIADQYSPLREFTRGACDFTPDGHVTSEDLYGAYRAWAVTEGEDRILGRRTFVSSFKDTTRGQGVKYGAHRVNKTDVVRGFRGIRLKTGTPTTAAAFQPKVVEK